jgi:hypothetical protein
MKLKIITIDLAKNVFQVCGVNEHITAVLGKTPIPLKTSPAACSKI